MTSGDGVHCVTILDLPCHQYIMAYVVLMAFFSDYVYVFYLKYTVLVHFMSIRLISYELEYGLQIPFRHWQRNRINHIKRTIHQ